MNLEFFGKYSKKNLVLRPSTLKTKLFSVNLRVGYVYIEKSFDTTFNIGVGGGALYFPPPLCIMGR